MGRRRGDRPGRRGRRPYRHRADHLADPFGCRRSRRPGGGHRRRRVLRRARPGGSPLVRRLRDRHGHPVPPLAGEPRARRGQAGLPGHPGDRHHRVQDDRRGTPTGDPYGIGRSPRACGLGPEPSPGPGQRLRLPAGDQDLDRRAPEGRSGHEGGERALLDPGDHGGQCTHDDQGRPCRWAHRRGRAAHRPGSGDDRGAADGVRPDRPDRGRGDGGPRRIRGLGKNRASGRGTSGSDA